MPATRTVWFEHANGHQVGATDGRWYFVTTLTDDMTFGLEVEIGPDGRRLPVVPVVPEGTTYLFDAELDPELTNDVGAEHPDVVERFREALASWRATAGGLERAGREMTPEEIEALNDLGYTDQLSPDGE